jgi:hypothetical protein
VLSAVYIVNKETTEQTTVNDLGPSCTQTTQAIGTEHKEIKGGEDDEKDWAHILVA